MKKPFFVLEYLLYISMLLQEGTSGYSAALYTRTPVNWTELLTNEMQTKHQDSQKKWSVTVSLEKETNIVMCMFNAPVFLCLHFQYNSHEKMK